MKRSQLFLTAIRFMAIILLLTLYGYNVYLIIQGKFANNVLLVAGNFMAVVILLISFSKRFSTRP